ncbi:hypothetical protein SISNIDRAFT_464691 [Sistotremastrum niveocremeum HHB9708]|uniref:Transmembrane protein n=1 Tax=Sistotremastrum niveocremeum HHB9708 TaxID=1314777 RepID=A0A164WG05_9AGAM|nr:hypothetical protein SISNIDRAFT_464691 [Sistotremastrum niveocremeum HHB9708]
MASVSSEVVDIGAGTPSLSSDGELSERSTPLSIRVSNALADLPNVDTNPVGSAPPAADHSTLPVIQDDPAPPYTETALEGLYPVSPSQSKRYTRKRFSAETIPTNVMIPPGLFSVCFPLPHARAPEGWRRQCHPEGQSYWHQPRLRVMTNADMSNPETAQAIVRWAHQIEIVLRARNLSSRSKIELVLEPEEGNNTCGYYFADHTRHSIFWLSATATDTVGLPPSLPPSTSFTHLELVLRQQFYIHVEYFPNHIILSETMEDTLCAMLSHGAVDGMTSILNHSTFPFNPEQCRALLDFIARLRDAADMQGYRTCAVARLLAEIYSHRIINFHGDTYARLSRLDNIWPKPNPSKSAWIVAAGQLLWRVPERHFQSLSNLWVDNIAYTHPWNDFVEGLRVEWERSVAIAVACIVCTLLLQIFQQSLEAASSASIRISSTFATAAILMALVGFIVGAILLHIRRDALEAEEIVAFIESKTHTAYGLHPLAIFLSVPFSTCLWSLALLSVAIIVGMFGTTNWCDTFAALLPFSVTLGMLYCALECIGGSLGLKLVVGIVGEKFSNLANWLHYL